MENKKYSNECVATGQCQCIVWTIIAATVVVVVSLTAGGQMMTWWRLTDKDFGRVKIQFLRDKVFPKILLANRHIDSMQNEKDWSKPNVAFAQTQKNRII